jgi:hypothetical protein
MRFAQDEADAAMLCRILSLLIGEGREKEYLEIEMIEPIVPMANPPMHQNFIDVTQFG